ncbi:MAG: sulfite exporter TauE/SafE family protein [Treponema sp.]|nr:sulfite exporter TauE/SafE family protein [Treponema sp.]
MESQNGTSVSLTIDGMTCINCQTKIEKRLRNTDGIISAHVSWEKSTAHISFDEKKITLDDIIAEIEALDYHVRNPETRSEHIYQTLLYLVTIGVLFLILQRTGILNILAPSGTAAPSMSYALLFVTGLLTSVHCVAMCGGINLSQSLPSRGSGSKKLARADFLPSLLYNLGRVVSYTLIGLALGTAGFFLGGGSAGDVSIPFSVQGILKIIAGLFMLLMGTSLLGIFPSLRAITPHLPAFLSKKIASAQVKNAAPFIVGFLNGFMPCGPLQAMWIVALASAHPLSGALSMLFFSAGTVPLMLALGSVVSLLGKKYTEVVMKIGAVLVVVMGLSMLSQGFALGGWNSANSANATGGEKSAATQGTEQKSSPKTESKSAGGSNIEIVDGKQIVKSTLNPYRYPAITVKKGVPVHWEIEAGENALNGCNYKMIFRDFGFMYTMDYGTNVIEFTPEKAGTFQYTCWMGMVRGVVTVVE